MNFKTTSSGLLVFLILLFAGCIERSPKTTTTFLVSTTLPKEEVVVTTDKLEYESGEIIKVTIKNNLEESIFSHVGKEAIKYIERKTAQGWEKFFARCQYPHCTYDIGPPKEITPKDSKTFQWNPLIFINGTSEYVQAKSGHYRLLILYENYKKTEWKTVYSNKFRIK